MSLYLEPIRQLVALQSVDDALRAIDAELAQAPREIEELTQKFAEIEAQRNRILEKVAHMTEQEKRLQNELEDDGSRIKKSKNKMMQVSNSREYQAMAREMDSMERMSRSREDDHTALREELKLQNQNLTEITKLWKATKTQLDEKNEGLEARLAEARERRTKKEAERSRTGGEVDRKVLERYEFIRRRLAHPVIVPVTEGVCAGCHISIPPQTFIELQGAHKILNCPNCQRLIYWSEHFHAEEEAARDQEIRDAEKRAAEAVNQASEQDDA